MSVPDYQSLMLPLLRFAREKKDESTTGEAVEVLAIELGLTDEDLKEMLPSGISSTFVNRVGWASTYMKKLVCLKPPGEVTFELHHAGRSFSKSSPRLSM